MDDALYGANTIEDALRLEQELIALLGRGRFHLLKFYASNPSVLEAVPPDCREMEVPIELDSNEGIKTLGLLWHPLSDQFLISKGTCAQKLREPKKSPVSKRIIYSIIAALQRFIAITGLTDHLYSDNCSNFVGANRELKVFIKSEEFLRHVHNYAAKTQFQWHFIPPNSPHFGGLW